MNNKYSKIKTAILVIVVLAFIASIPAVIQNSAKTNQAKKDIKELLDMTMKVCNGGCDPTSWEIAPEKQDEAKTYCLAHCQNNMKGIRDSLLNEGFPILFTNQYNYRIAQIYCLLGLNCPQKEISDLIKDY